jgi:hypothetical protein
VTDDERAKRVEEMSGVNIAEFMRDVIEAGPYVVKDGTCMYCGKAPPTHEDGCLWTRLVGGAP